MDKEYYNEMKQTALDVKAALTGHLQDYGRPNVGEDIICLSTVALIADVAKNMAHRAENGYLPQHTDELYCAFIESAVACIVAANKVRNG